MRFVEGTCFWPWSTRWTSSRRTSCASGRTRTCALRRSRAAISAKAIKLHFEQRDLVEQILEKIPDEETVEFLPVDEEPEDDEADTNADRGDAAPVVKLVECDPGGWR